MSSPFVHAALLLLSIAACGLSVLLWRALRLARRAEFIRGAALPPGLFGTLQQRHPALGAKECQLVAQGLRQFFLAYLQGGRKAISMPSKAVDTLWHDFILHTRAYEVFCRQAFGRLLHHTPAAALGSGKRSNEGLRRCWWWACRAENIDPNAATRLPLLFALDAKLGIEGGFRYVPDCGPLRRAAGDGNVGIVIHCGSDFADKRYDGGTDGLGDGGDGDGGGGCGD